jgi:hypothetical protein
MPLRTLLTATGQSATVDPDPPPFTPLLLQPGQTVTITVTITPDAPHGTVVTGHLFVDDFSGARRYRRRAAPIPYAYTVD